MNSEINKKIKIARVVTVPEAFVHIKPLLHFLGQQDAQVCLISSEGAYEKVLFEELNLKVLPIEIPREINLIKDIFALIKLIICFRRNQFDIIHSSTPKAGLLTAIAGLFSIKSVRLHTFTGQRWATLRGPLRWLLKFFDKLIISLDTQCYADSKSQIEYLKKEGVASDNEIRCLNKGSYGGVDCRRFNKERYPNARKELLSKLKINSDSVLVLYVGRITKDKGIDDLVKAFKISNEKNKKIKLILVGECRENLDIIDSDTKKEISSNPDIFSMGYQNHPELFFSSADIFCMPSYREGFGTVVLEAAACELMTVGTKIPGLTDAIVDHETGVLVEPADYKQLADVLQDFAQNEYKRTQFGLNAKIRAQNDFNSELLSKLQWDEYLKLLITKRFVES